jgi:hypothetical protein
MMNVGSQIYTPGAFIPGKKALSTHCIREWVNPGAGMDPVAKRNTPLSWESNPDRLSVALHYTQFSQSNRYFGPSENMRKLEDGYEEF